MMPSNELLLNQARASHARGDLAAAVRAYDTILKLDPRNYEAAYLRAVALYQAGRLEPAAAAFALAASINPRKVEAHKDRGLVLVKLGRHQEALACFETATRLSPGSPELLLNRGLAEKNTGRLAAAVESYEAALRLKPGFAEAHNNLANALSELGRKEDALAHYRSAFTLRPQYGEAYVNAARLLMELERPEDAMAVLEEAIAANPRHAEAHRSLAECLDVLGRLEDALACATRAVACDPKAVNAYLTRASLHEALQRDDEALADYESALALQPRDRDALLGKAQLLCRRSRYEEAVTLCDTAVAADPSDARGYYHIGRALEGRREIGAAIASYEKAAALDPDWLAPLLRRASAINEQGRQQEALAAYDAAIARHPGAAEAHFGRGDVLRAMRRQEEALAAYDEAIALAPDKAFYRGVRGSLKGEMGEVDAALEDFGGGLKLIALGKPLAEAMVEDCIRLLSVDKIPAIYATEADLARTRARIEDQLDELARKYDSPTPLSAEQRQISEQAVRYLTGFFIAYHQYNDRETMRRLSEVATRLLSLPVREIGARAPGGGRIRVGIASQRLRDHNGANWAYNWFAHLPRDDYEIFTYSFDRSSDQLAQKFAALGSHRQLTWSRADPHEVVAEMRADDLDVLMLPDVGMTAVSRFLSLQRMAPLQFTAWGHPVTTGSPEMDCYLSSDLMEPADGQDHYTERLVRLPNLALYLDEEAEADGTPAAHRFGLPEGRVLYGCLQSLFKYLPRHDEILPLIAREVPDALFVFLEGMPAYTTAVMQERLAAAFAAQGLDAARHVTFLPRQTPADYDRLMQAMDVLVDSVGWSGGNTSLKAINCGVPLATREGVFMRGRHTSAMFRMIGAEEMIADSAEAYVGTLVRLGRDKDYRRHCAELFRDGRPRLWRDRSLIAAFDAFLKSQGRR